MLLSRRRLERADRAAVRSGDNALIATTRTARGISGANRRVAHPERCAGRVDRCCRRCSAVVGQRFNAGATDTVFLRNLSINGAGTGINGIRFIAGGTLIVDNSTIFNQGAAGVDQGNGIDFNPAAASKIFVRRTSVRNNAGFGIYVRPQAGGTAVGTLKSVDANKNNTGIRVLDRGTITAIDVESSGNSQNGFRTLSTGAALFLNIVDSVSTDNPNFGIKSEGALSVVHVAQTNVTKNGTGVNATGGAILLSFTNNAVGGNTANGAFTGTIALS